MSLSPAAAALEADLCLLTRLPVPKEADLDAIKERVFGSVEGVPRTETQSKRRYVDAIVEAFDASGATSIDTFGYDVRCHAALCARMSIVLEEHADMHRQRDAANSEVRRLQSIIDEQDTEHEDVSDDLRRVREEYDAVRHERDDLREACETMRQERDKAIRWHDKNVAAHNTMQRERDEALTHVKRLQEINERLETRNREAVQAGASFGVETCGLLAEKGATIRDVRATFDDLFVKWETTCRERDAARREATASRAELCALNAEISHLRSDLASTRAAHAEITAAHAKLAADVAHKDRLMRDMNAALTHAREEAKAAHDALTAEQGRTERLRAVVADLIADLNAAKEGAE